MLVRPLAIFFLLALASCAGRQITPPVMQTDKEFAVPKNLVDQFAVHESVQGSAQKTAKADLPSAPAEPALTAKTESGGQGKSNGKTTKATKKAKKMKEPVVEASKAPAPVPNRWTMPPFFKEGERTVFDITYFGATAGKLELEVLPQKIVSERSSYHFRAIASSTSVFSLFYRVNDVAESFMDSTGLFSHKFSLKLDESRQTRDVLELYDQQKRKAYYWSKWDLSGKPRQNEQSEIDLVPFTQDGLSSFFYVRTLPLELGKTYDFPMVNNGKLRTVRVTALRKEELTTRMGDFHAIVVKPEVVLDGVLQSYGDSFIWISDDADRQILKIDAKIKVGSVIAYLRERSYGHSASAK